MVPNVRDEEKEDVDVDANEAVVDAFRKKDEGEEDEEDKSSRLEPKLDLRRFKLRLRLRLLMRGLKQNMRDSKRKREETELLNTPRKERRRERRTTG